MKRRSSIVVAMGSILLAVVVFQWVQRQLSDASFAFGAYPEVLELLERSLADQKRLAELDPSREAEYRRAFAENEATLHRLQILEHARGDLIARYETILLTFLGLSFLAVGGVLVWRQTRREERLERLRAALGSLAEGRPVLDSGERGRGTIGRIAAMIEETSRRMAGDRQRLAMLENLSAWQEAARRHAHEMRTPITGLRLEFSRLEKTLTDFPETSSREEFSGYLEGARHELDRLTEFTHRFSSFARLPEPRLALVDLAALLADVAEVYSDAWANLEIRLDRGEALLAEVDRDMIRQVLVNLFDNSSAAAAPHPVVVTLEIGQLDRQTVVTVADNGPGIASQVSDRLFQPYTTTRTVGEGMGLGLAISKKILLDHGGDLRLLASSDSGATFQLSLPAPASEIDSSSRRTP